MGDAVLRTLTVMLESDFTDEGTLSFLLHSILLRQLPFDVIAHNLALDPPFL